jgi:hypothetical protein
MLFEVEFLQRRTIVVETFDLKCAEALVQRFRQEQNEKRPGEVIVVSVKPAERQAEAA